jgi:hypothetical protein
MSEQNERSCPICGEGVLQHLGPEDSERLLRPESPIIETYTYGHQVATEPLGTADAGRLDVERRASEDTVDDVGGEGSGSPG